MTETQMPQNETPADVLAGRLADVPATVIDRIRQGFEDLSKFPEQEIRRVVASISRKIAEGSGPGRSDVQEIISVGDRSADSIMFSVSVLFAMLLDLPATLDDFTSVAQGKLFDEASRLGAQVTAAEISSNRSELKDAVDHGNLSNSLLPSMQRFDVEVDVRFRFDGDDLARCAPLALIHIDTDVDRQEIFFQANPSELRSMIDKLTTAMENIEKAKVVIDRIHPR